MTDKQNLINLEGEPMEVDKKSGCDVIDSPDGSVMSKMAAPPTESTPPPQRKEAKDMTKIKQKINKSSDPKHDTIDSGKIN